MKYAVRKTIRTTNSKLMYAFTALVIGFSSAAGALPFLFTQTAFAAETFTVTEDNTRGWNTQDTRVNGHVDYALDADAPSGIGALSLITDNVSTGNDKAQYYNYKHYAEPIALSSVTGVLSYWTKQNAASFAAGLPAYQIPVYLKSDTETKFATLTYEPYVDKGNAAVQNGIWQEWDIDQASSKFYSSRTMNNADGEGVVVSQGSSTYTLSEILAMFPETQALGFGVNLGTNNPGYDTLVDQFTFNGDTYDFEPVLPDAPTNLGFAQAGLVCGDSTSTNYITAQWNTVDDAVQYRYNVAHHGTFYEEVKNTNTHSGSFGGGVGQEGTYTFKVKSIAANGIESNWSNDCSITYDVTAPTTPANGVPNNGYKTSNDFYFTWDASNDASPVTYEFQSSTTSNTDANGGLVGAWNSIRDGNSEQKNLTSPSIHSTGAPDGTYYWQVRAIDAAGNTSPWSQTWNMTIDKNVPTATITSPTAGQVISITRISDKKLKITGTASDSDFNYYYCYVTGAGGEVGVRDAKCQTAWALGTRSKTAFAETSSGTTDSTLGYVTLSGVPDGNYSVHLVAKDKAGNTTEATQAFVVDNTKPSIAFVSPASFSNQFTSGPSVSVNASDANGLKALVVHVYDSNDNPAKFCNGNSAQVAAGSLTCDLTELEDGSYYIKAGTTDVAGNNKTILSGNFEIDSTAPSLPTSALTAGGDTVDTNGVTNSEDFTFNLTSPDATRYQLKYWNDIPGSNFKEASPWSPTDLAAFSSALGTYNDSFTQGEGTHYFSFSACDAAGNCSAFAAPFVVTYDATAPNAPEATPVAGTYTGTQSVTLTGDDASSIYYTTDGTTPSKTNGTLYSSAFNVTDDATVKAVAYDEAGNMSSVTTAAYVVNAAPAGGTNTNTGNNTVTTVTNNNNVQVAVNTTQVAQTGNAAANNNTAGGDAQTGDALNANTAVLGVNIDNGESDDAEVLGASTENKVVELAATTNNGNFLGLGWWWLLVGTALAGFLFGLLRRSDSNKA